MGRRPAWRSRATPKTGPDRSHYRGTPDPSACIGVHLPLICIEYCLLCRAPDGCTEVRHGTPPVHGGDDGRRRADALVAAKRGTARHERTRNHGRPCGQIPSLPPTPGIAAFANHPSRQMRSPPNGHSMDSTLRQRAATLAATPFTAPDVRVPPTSNQLLSDRACPPAKGLSRAAGHRWRKAVQSAKPDQI